MDSFLSAAAARAADATPRLLSLCCNQCGAVVATAEELLCEKAAYLEGAVWAMSLTSWTRQHMFIQRQTRRPLALTSAVLILRRALVFDLAETRPLLTTLGFLHIDGGMHAARIAHHKSVGFCR